MFYLRLYVVRHMVKTHTYNTKEKLLPSLKLLVPISSTDYRVALALNGYIMKDRPDNPSDHERTLLPRSYISLLLKLNVKCSVSILISKSISNIYIYTWLK